MPIPAFCLSPTNFCLRGKPTPDPPLTPSPAAQSVPALDHLPAWASPVSVQACQTFSASLADQLTGSSDHLSVTHICQYLAPPRHPLLPDIETSSSQPPLSITHPDSCFRALVSAKIFSIVALRCDLGPVCLHQVSQRLPPPLYPI